jgi:hypothetical protein
MAWYSSLGGAMRIAVGWIGRKVTAWLIGQLLIWLLTSWLAWLINKLMDDIEALLSEMNDAVLARIFVVEDLLFQVQNSIYGAVDTLLNVLQSNIVGALDVFTPEGNAAVKTLLNWAAWVDGFFSDIGSAVGNAAGTVASTLISPVLSVVSAARSGAESVESSLQELDDRAQAMLDLYNANILEIKGNIEAGISVDWDAYILTVEDLGVDLVPDSITGLVTDLQSAESSLTALPASFAADVASAFNSTVAPDFKTTLESFLDNALVQAIRYKKTAVNSYFTTMRNDLSTELNTSQQALIDNTVALRDELQAIQIALIEKLPDILEPTLKDAIDRIKEQIIQQEEGIMVNVDQFLIDTRTVDTLLQRLKPREMGDAPTKFDTVEWTLNDIYRILANYFFRHERMALAVAIAAVDMDITSQELLGLMADAAPYDNMEEVEETYQETSDDVWEGDLWGPLM